MFPIALTKWFFDLWDQLFFVLFANFLFTAAFLGLGILLPGVRFDLLIVLVLTLYVPFTAFYAQWAKDLAVHGVARWSDAWKNLKASWRLSLALMAAWLLLGLGWVVGIPFYSEMNPWVGLGFAAVLFWAAFFLAGMGVFLPGLNAQVGGTLGSLVRKSFLLMMAHPLQTLVFWVVGVLMVALSVFTLGFFPGMIGVQLWFQIGFRFLLAKYEYFEAHPELDRKKGRFPWKAALQDDLERLGPRSLRSMIFPWRD